MALFSWDKTTDRTRAVLHGAAAVAAERNHRYIGLDDVIISIAKDPIGRAMLTEIKESTGTLDSSIEEALGEP